jgi:hypothetical protein
MSCADSRTSVLNFLRHVRCAQQGSGATEDRNVDGQQEQKNWQRDPSTRLNSGDNVVDDDIAMREILANLMRPLACAFCHADAGNCRAVQASMKVASEERKSWELDPARRFDRPVRSSTA